MSIERKINLSYVLTTFNKLSYLKVTLPDLISSCKEDEEIVVFDGGSKDGTREFVEALYNEGKIHQFVSERDFGEAHGYNKAMLAAKGEIIKIISDDDAYDFSSIEFSKKFMLANKQVHLIAADGFGVNNLIQENNFHRRNTLEEFRNWKAQKKPFIFCGLSILLRKDALPLLGFWNQHFLIIDFEYSLRVTSGKATLGWCTALNYVNIINENSNSGNHWKRMEIEKEMLERLYLNKKPLISFRQKDSIKNLFRPLKHKLFPGKAKEIRPYEAIYHESKKALAEANKQISYEVVV